MTMKKCLALLLALTLFALCGCGAAPEPAPAPTAEPASTPAPTPTPTPEPTATPEPPLVITVPNVPANGSIMLVYEAEVTAYAPLGTDGSITNTANVTDGNLEVSASETVSTEDRAVLTISKALCPAVVTGNGQITYTFVIENTGNTEASEAERIVLTDTFDPILKNIAVTFNGTAWTAGTQYTYTETTGVFATLPGQITVPAATYTQDPVTGAWAVTPGVSELIVTGTV